MAESVVGALAGKLVKHLDQLSGNEGIAPFLTEQQVTDLKQTLKHIQYSQLESEDGAFIGADDKDMLNKLKGALYRLDDLLDDVVIAMAMKGSNGKIKLTNIVSFCSFLSCSQSTSSKKSTAVEAKAILEDLQYVSMFMSMRDPNIPPVDPSVPAALTLSEEKNPLWREEELIGMDGDRKIIEERISRSDADTGDSVAVIPIIGISGSGKTALARAVFRDEHVQKNFEVKGWACLSHLSSLENLLKTILESILGCDCRQLGLTKLKSSLLDAILDKKYLIVLDDARDNHRDALHNLTSLLKEGQRGSRILLTSRSRSLAKLMGTVEPHELGGLPDHHAWDLFEGLAFIKGREELAGIGRDIVRECRNVPLVIRIIAALLYSKETLQEWEDFKNNELKMINGDEEMEDVQDHVELKKKECDENEDVKDRIEPEKIKRDEQREDVKDSKLKKMSFKGKERVDFEHNELGKKDQDEQRILAAFRLSYKHLPPKLKACFIYCSLFPKNYELNSQDLIYFWMAEGFIEPSTERDAQRPEDVGDGYGHFMELLRRCFFKDVKKDEYGKIISCKMHDSAHDLARVEASFDCSTTLNRRTTFWHASFIVESSWKTTSSWWCDRKQLRSLLLLPGKPQVPFAIQDFNQTLLGLRCLRTLDLMWACCEIFPNSIGELKHLRYLRLGGTLVSLPESIASVVNLQTLDLQACHQLRRLPTSLNKLVKLRHLKAKETLIDDMPPDFGLLTSLQTLDLFVVGGNNGLDVLNKLSGIVGDLEIRFKKHRGEDKSLDNFDISSRNLTSLILKWSSSYEKSVASADELRDDDDMVLQRLQPSSSVKSLEVRHWKGVNFPKWTIALAELVSLKIKGCSWCQYLPLLGQLPSLKSLELANLDNLEYIERDGDCKKASTEIFFPLLENLKLVNLLKLKGWSKEQPDKKDHWTSSFSLLSELTVRGCPDLMSMPLVPQLWSLSVSRIHKKLLRQLLAAKESPAAPSSSSPPPRLSIESVHNLDSLSINIFSIESLSITECQELTKLAAVSVTYLPYLEIRSCRRLKDISEALWRVDHLDKLVIDDCEQIDWGDSLEDYGWPMPRSLRSLELRRILKLEALPNCLISLSLLEELRIYGLRNLTALPEYVEKLYRLRQLHIQDCLQLTVLPEQIDRLDKLRQLCIQHCPQLKALPKSRGFLARLQKFWIRECHSELVRRCRKPDGEYWPLIRNIPLRSVQ